MNAQLSNLSEDRSKKGPKPLTSRRSMAKRVLLQSLTAASLGIALMLLLTQRADTQTTTSSSSSDRPCPVALTPGQNLFTVPVIGSANGILRGTMTLGSEQVWMAFRVPVSAPSDGSTSQCQPQFVRTYRELGAVSSMASVPSGPFSKGSYALPRPGPTLRARVGDLVELTFLNQINVGDFGSSIDRGVAGKCDESTAGYPGKPGAAGSDTFPDCFNGSSTGNIHFHGTHTNPNTTGDNVFLEIQPSLRDSSGKPVVTPESVAQSFGEFFKQCEANVSATGLSQWPTSWNDLPEAWRKQQESLLKAYDTQLEKDYGPSVQKLWPINEQQLMEGAWPQYYVGAYPYCFRLPDYTDKTWPPPAGAKSTKESSMKMPMDMPMPAGMKMPRMAPDKPLMMGQSPGTHWYHAHKHGSTAINVANGTTGVFIIEGQYDDDLNAFYGKDWTRDAKVLVINQLGVSPNLMRGAGSRQDKGPDFSVNGQLKPVVQMRPGEVQMWRIANSSGRAGAFFVGPPGEAQWKQIAQDGVQFSDVNYQGNSSRPFLLAAGNRADLLVKAPSKEGTYGVMVQNVVDPSDAATAAKITLLSIKVSGQPVDPGSPSANFKPRAPSFPPFLADIQKSEVSGTKTIVFATKPGPGGGPGNAASHTIDGKKFDGEVGEVVLLNKTEEWKIVNDTIGISHPFHIHINPFQVVEVFDPNELIPDPQTGKQINKYVFDKRALKVKGQCYLDPYGDPDNWKPCDPAPYLVQPNLIWWDVFPIPSGANPTDADGNQFINPITKAPVQIPGYFKMRSRFVDYAGQYVIHCHILAHEDRGMMNIVEVVPYLTPYHHH